MARPKPQSPLREIADGLEQNLAFQKRLRVAYPDLRRLPPAKREAIKLARAKLEESAEALRQIIELDAQSDET